MKNLKKNKKINIKIWIKLLIEEFIYIIINQFKFLVYVIYNII